MLKSREWNFYKTSEIRRARPNVAEPKLMKKIIEKICF
jgi:hypothetical protein